jgi:hypothetical protein
MRGHYHSPENLELGAQQCERFAKDGRIAAAYRSQGRVFDPTPHLREAEGYRRQAQQQILETLYNPEPCRSCGERYSHRVPCPELDGIFRWLPPNLED